MPTQLRISELPELQLVARQGLQELGILVGAGFQDRAVEILVDQKWLKPPDAMMPMRSLPGKLSTALRMRLAELIAARAARLVRRVIGVEENRHDRHRLAARPSAWRCT